MSSLQAYRSMSFTNQADAQGFHHIFQDDEEGDSFTYIRVRTDKDKPPMGSEPFARQVATMIAVLNDREENHGLSIMSGHMMQLKYSPRSLVREQELQLSTEEASWSSKVTDGDERWDILRDIVAQHARTPRERQPFIEVASESHLVSADLETYHYDHVSGGSRYGSERATMHPMVQSLIENTKGEIASIENYLIERGLVTRNEDGLFHESLETWSMNERMMLEQIFYLHKILEQAQAYQASGKGSMIDSNYYRDLLKEALEVRALEAGRDLLDGAPTEVEALKKKAAAKGRFDQTLYQNLFRQKAIELGKQTLSKEDWDAIQEEAADNFIPFLSNCWRQTARSNMPDGTVGKEMSWMRLGAFYDSRNILFSLQDLLDPIEGCLSQEELIERAEVVVQDLLDRKEDIHESKKPPKDSQEYLSTMAAIDYALKRLVVNPEEGNWDVNVNQVLQWVAERRTIAQTHFLSLLEAQVSQLKPGDASLDWAHVSLLKPHEDKIEKMGWTHCEKNELQDMKWAFDHFRGAQITFSDEPGLPRIEYDANGKPFSITLNRQHIQGRRLGDQPIVLNSHLVSCSVASRGISSDGAYNDDAKGIQRDINVPFFEEVIEAPEEEGGFGGQYQTLTTDEQKKRMATLRAGQSSFYAAEDLGLELLQRGWCVSANCQSGKDRTGYVCSRLAQRVVLEGLEKAREAGRVTGVNYHLRRYLLNLRPFEPERVTQQVLRANTGANYVKVGVANVPGSDPFYLRRIRHYAGLAFEAIRGTKKSNDA